MTRREGGAVPKCLLFDLMFAGMLSAVLGAILIAAGLVGPVLGGAIVILGLIVAFVGVRLTWTGEGPSRGSGDARPTADE